MLQSIINPLNDTVLYGYDTGNNRNSITDRNGKMTKYVYDTLGNVLSTIEPGPDGDTTFTEYNNQTFRDLPTKMIDAAGIETDWTYDNYGNVVSELKNNVTKSWTYNTFGQVITETNGCGNVTQYVYSADGLLLQTISPEGNSKWYGYDSLWRKTSETDGRGSTSGDPYYTTTFIYDNADRLVQTIGPAPDSITRTYTYDQVGNKISETDGNGNMTDYSYDNNNNLLTVTDSTGTTTYVYDQLDRKISMTDANNHTTSYTYDNADRLVSLTDSEGNIWMYIYDKQGNMLSETDPSGITMTYEYNSLNKQILAKDELENTRKSTYDPLGRLTSYINANNDTITYSYDAFGRLITVNEPGGGITQYSYDNCGNLLQIMDASTHQVNTREYDQDNRLTKNYDGIGNFYQYSYNENGNISSMTDAKGQTTYYEYDAYNRISQVDYPDGLIISYTYDNNGNVLIMTDTPGSNTFTYDSRNRLLSSTDRYGKQVHYQYDAVGNRTALIYPDNKQVNYTYDDASRLTAVTDWNGNITHYHYSGSRVDSITFPNNLTEIREYDIAGRLTEMTTGDTLLSLLWQRDGEGNPVSAAEKGTLLPEVPSNDIYYDYDSDNRLNNSSEGNYTYDNDGNLIMRRLIDDTTAFSYNSQNLLIAQQKGNHIIQHVYDGNGNRIARIENGVERRYVLDLGSPMSNVLCETDNTGNISAYYIYGTQLIAKVDSIGTRHYYHTNNLSTVLALSNESGTITDRYAYGPFGDLYMQEGITANPFKYVGGLGVMFEDNRLYFMRARFYDPETGRFLSKDPVEGSLNTPVGLNKYVYGLNDPLFFIDPKGEVAPLVALGLAAIAGGTVNLGSYLFFDVYLEKKDFKWEAAGAKFVGGAAGTLTAILSAPFVSPIASMAAGGAVSEAIGSIGSTNDPGEVAANTIYGAFAGGLIGKILPSSAIGFKMNNGGILQTFSKNSGRFVSISEILSAELIGEMTTNTISKLIYPSIRTSGTNVPLIWQNNVIWNALSVKSYHYSL
jgi:RHS repeat-associated protein